MPRGLRNEWTIDTGSIDKLARTIKQASPAVAKTLTKELKLARDAVAAEARSRASFSTKIPATIKGSGTGATLKVSAGGAAAPNAAPLENRGKQGTFRHPVFGTDTWVNQQAHPFLTPALAAQREILAARIDAAIDKAIDAL